MNRLKEKYLNEVVPSLKEKYNYQIQKNIINPIIGEYDDPENQIQNILCRTIHLF